MGWKYVIIEIQEGYRFPVIFSDKLIHADVAKAFEKITPSKHLAVAVSAGTINVVDVTGVGGSSETLKLESFGIADEHLINNYNYNHGII